MIGRPPPLIHQNNNIILLQSEEENTLVSGLPDGSSGLHGYWTGGIYENNQGRWTDGSTFNFTKWSPGNPNNGKPAYIEMVKGENVWNDAYDEWSKPFFCEYKQRNNE